MLLSAVLASASGYLLGSTPMHPDVHSSVTRADVRAGLYGYHTWRRAQMTPIVWEYTTWGGAAPALADAAAAVAEAAEIEAVEEACDGGEPCRWPVMLCNS